MEFSLRGVSDPTVSMRRRPEILTAAKHLHELLEARWRRL
jgi:hypothetical protein